MTDQSLTHRLEPMPRPSDPHARARLLDAARAVFSDRGLDRAKVEDITKRARLSKGAFYLHFASKEEAFRELLADVILHLERMLNETSAEQFAMGPGDVSFVAYLDMCHAKNVEIYDFVWENRALMAMVLEGGGSASYGHLIEDFAERAQRQTAVMLQHGVDIGLYRTDLNLEVAAAFIAGGFDRLARQLVREQKKPDLDTMLREAMRLFVGGIARPDIQAVLNREDEKLSEKRAVSRDEPGTRGAISG